MAIAQAARPNAFGGLRNRWHRSILNTTRQRDSGMG